MRYAALLLLSLPSCAAGDVQDAAHGGGVPLVAGLTAGAATLNPLVGGGTALATWVAEMLIPDGEEARDALQDEEAINQLIEILKARGLVTKAEVEQAKVAAERRAANESRGLIEGLESLMWTTVKGLVAAALAWVVGGYLIRRYIQKKNISPLDSLLKDAGQAEKLKELLDRD